MEFPGERSYLSHVERTLRTFWVYSPEFLNHNSGLSHPESPERLRSILDRLAKDGTLEHMALLNAAPASDDELALVHTRRHIDTIQKSGGRQLDPDTFCGRETPSIARLAAGSVLAVTRSVMAGEAANAVCLVRPPGHHATADRAMGFCYFNNVAVAAADVVKSRPASRVLILDWDVHHGNGTQAIFYESEKVLYASVHQYPFYPGTGAAGEIGRGTGRGFTVNKPLRAGAGDEEFLGAITEILDETATLMRPDCVFISAGFDAHRDDPLAGLNVSVDGFAEATRRVCAYADEHCGGKVISVLEGGYDTRALSESVSAHVQVLIDHG